MLVSELRWGLKMEGAIALAGFVVEPTHCREQ